MLGLCALLGGFFVTSNRESGEGRYDIQLKPVKYSKKPEFGIRLCHKVYGTTRHDISSLHKCEWLSIVCKK